MLVNMNFWLAKMYYQNNDLLEKAVVLKKFEYSPLGKELKAQTSPAEKQYQKLDSFWM